MDSKELNYSPHLPYNIESIWGERSPFLYPKGLKHFLALRAPFRIIVDFLKQEGLLLMDPQPMHNRNDVTPSLGFVCKWKNGLSSAGTDTNPAAALTKALAEGLERLTTKTPEFDINLPVEFKKTKGNIINPYAKETYFKEQKHPGLDLHNEKFREMRNLLTHKTAYIPERYIFWGDGLSRIQALATTTNGGGAHTKKDLALISALHEYIERDAFLLSWLTKTPPLLLELSSIQEEKLKITIANIQARGLDLSIGVFDGKVGIPTFVSFIFDKRNTVPVFALGGAVNSLNPMKAIEHAVSESLQVLQEVLKEPYTPSNESTIMSSPFLETTLDRKGRLLFWRGEITKELNWLKSGKKITYETLLESFPPLTIEKSSTIIDHMCSNLEPLEIYEYEVQSKILSMLGLKVVKLYIPQLLTFYLFENSANVNVPRLQKFFDTTKLYENLNPMPHPYP